MALFLYARYALKKSPVCPRLRRTSIQSCALSGRLNEPLKLDGVDNIDQANHSDGGRIRE